MSPLWPSRASTKQHLEAALRKLATRRPMPGIADPKALETLTLQLVASIRREDYTDRLIARKVSTDRTNPHKKSFDADRAVAFHLQQRDIDEASWLIFLMTHFGKPAEFGWRRLADVYGQLGQGRWSWNAITADTDGFDSWLAANWKSIGGKFGNHRKYETLNPASANSTGNVIRSYVSWVGPSKSHSRLFAQTIRATGNDPHKIFDELYQGMNVRRFGRLAKFDYLALVGRYKIAPIVPGSAYLEEATGPAAGARLLFDGQVNGTSKSATLQAGFDELSAALGVGMQVLEDAICNWQKSPKKFVHFKG